MFCQSDSNKITREHIIPDWINEFAKKYAHFRNEIVRDDGEILHTYGSSKFDGKINDVCEVCNSTWMSIIENEVKPIFLMMLNNKNFVLDRKKQNRISLWAIKTALVANYNNPSPEQPIVPKDAYVSFFEAPNDFNRTTVTLGYSPVTGTLGELTATIRVMNGQNLSVPKELHEIAKVQKAAGKTIYGVTIQLFNIVLQVVGSNIDLGSNLKFELFIPPEPFRQIQPVKTKIRWPLRHTIHEVGGIDVVHNALAGS